MTGTDYFSKSYALARSRFIAAACAAGATMEELHFDTKGPGGMPLAIEIARFGAADPQRVVIHTSGVHGVEGFAGSAIQLALLESGFAIPEDGAVILVHCINPYGMAWLRRVNERNVDLNRNFIFTAAERRGAADIYHQLNDVLNPAGKPGVIDSFYLRAARTVLRYGMSALRQAIAEGQYEYPQGLFYGGEELEKGPLLYLGWLSLKLKSVRRVFAVDVHTGLGKWGKQTLFYRTGGEQQAGVNQLNDQLGHQLIADTMANGGYTIRGMLSEVFDVLESKPDWTFVLQEFGTYPALQVLNGLRLENQWTRYGIGVEHPCRQRLKRLFVPEDPRWRENVIQSGVTFFRRALDYTFA